MERVLDQQGRWRNKVIAFRMSPEEDEVLEAKVKLSGLTKQEYIIRRLTDREITVVGNPRVYKALRDQMRLIYQELQRLAVDEEVPPDLLETLQIQMCGSSSSIPCRRCGKSAVNDRQQG